MINGHSDAPIWMLLVVLLAGVIPAMAQTASEPALDPARSVFADRIDRYVSEPGTECEESIFAPPVDEFFRQRAREALGQDERLLLAGTDEWLGALSPRLVQYLPDLPPGIEYRLVRANLVLWDVHAETIVDVLPDALW
jgi:hypothetical protein